MKLADTLYCMVVAIALAFAGMTGCKEKGAATTPAAEKAAAQNQNGPAKMERASAEGKKWKGWQWEGTRQKCFFLVDKTCFGARAEACTAAGCGEGTCQATEEVPARVSCQQ